MLSVALFSFMENIKLLFTASFGRVLNYLSLSSSHSYFSIPIPLSWGPSCPACSGISLGSHRLYQRAAPPAPGQPVSPAPTMHLPSLVKG